MPESAQGKKPVAESKRFFIKSTKQGLIGDLVLRDHEHNHLANVLRLKTGDNITAVCGDEFDYHYQITKITKQITELKYIDRKINQSNPQKKLTVYMGLIKFDNLAISVQKLNEIGAHEVVFFNSKNCQNLPVKIDKLQTIAEQSCKQCGRSIPVIVRGILNFEQLLTQIPSNAIFADEREIVTSLDDVSISKIENNATIIVGCEGGFTEPERAKLAKVTKPVSLGRRILRAETAVILTASIVLAKLGEI